jgi:hypothetical protein
MKKFLAVLAIAGALTSCGNSGNTNGTGTDSVSTTTVTTDSATTVSPSTVDSSSNKMMTTDSSK